jgi:riboflavin synthase alpha subunit
MSDLHAFLFKVNAEEGWFNLMLVVHTQSVIIMPHKLVGSRVNLEVRNMHSCILTTRVV